MIWARTLRHGMTLLEMLVTLVVLGLLASVATLAPRPKSSRASPERAMLLDSLSAAIAQGRQITIAARLDGRDVFATVTPDGRVSADSEFHASIP